MYIRYTPILIPIHESNSREAALKEDRYYNLFSAVNLEITWVTRHTDTRRLKLRGLAGITTTNLFCSISFEKV